MGRNVVQSESASADMNRTSAQISILLRVIAQAERLCARQHETGGGVDFHPEAEKAAAETYALAQQRLRDLIDEQARWSTGPDIGADLQRKIAEAHERVLQKQESALELAQAPHIRLNAKLINVGHCWLAYTGEFPPLQSSLLGEGPGPAEALAEFDASYLRRLPEAQTLEIQPAPAPKKRKKKSP